MILYFEISNLLDQLLLRMFYVHFVDTVCGFHPCRASFARLLAIALWSVSKKAYLAPLRTTRARLHARQVEAVLKSITTYLGSGFLAIQAGVSSDGFWDSSPFGPSRAAFAVAVFVVAVPS
jgi:hypothetical protein